MEGTITVGWDDLEKSFSEAVGRERGYFVHIRGVHYEPTFLILSFAHTYTCIYLECLHLDDPQVTYN